MQFLRENEETAALAIAKDISSHLLANERVLWLVSGGSNIGAEVAIMQLLHEQAREKLGSLAIMPMDERYGKPGHADSNMHKLTSAGFNAGEAVLVDVLVHDVSEQLTTEFYADVLRAALDNAAYVIGQFGLGDDGHTAGVLPGSPATEPSDNLVVSYAWKDFYRLTLTVESLRLVQTGYVLAYGASKEAALLRLQAHTEQIVDLPSTLLYDIANVVVYNDHIETNHKG